MCLYSVDLGDSDGYTTLPGAWTTEDSKQHPHGLEWLVKQVKSLGFKNGLGLWCAPFCESTVF